MAFVLVGMFVNDEFLDFVGSSKCLLILDGDAGVVVVIIVVLSKREVVTVMVLFFLNFLVAIIDSIIIAPIMANNKTLKFILSIFYFVLFC